jgi:hypothetical protein
MSTGCTEPGVSLTRVWGFDRLQGLSLRKIYHAAGSLSDALLPNQNAAGVRTVFAAKVCIRRPLLMSRDNTHIHPHCGHV